MGLFKGKRKGKFKKWIKKNGRKIVGGVVTAAGGVVGAVTSFTGIGAVAGGAMVGAGIKMMKGKNTKEVLGGAAGGAMAGGGASMLKNSSAGSKILNSKALSSVKLVGNKAKKHVQAAKEIVPLKSNQVGKIKIFKRIGDAARSEQGQKIMNAAGAGVASAFERAKANGAIKTGGEPSAFTQGVKSEALETAENSVYKAGAGLLGGILLLLVAVPALFGNKKAKRRYKNRRR